MTPLPRDPRGGWTLADPDATAALGAALAVRARPPQVIALHGPLGAGKTCLAQGLGAALGHEEVVSPTFALMIEHPGPQPLLHVDAWRLSPAEARAIGLDEAIEAWPGLVLVEWADKVEALLPDDRLNITLLDEGEGSRRLLLGATGPRSEALRIALEADLG